MALTVFQADPATDLEPYAVEREMLASAGIELKVGNCTTEDEVIERAGDAEVLWLGWLPILTPKVMDALPALRLMVRWGVGYEQFDLPAATARGVACANAPRYGSDDVAEHAIALLLAGARRLTYFHERMRTHWPSVAGTEIHRMKGRTLGIIGLGRIGSSAAWRANGLGLKVIAYDLYKSADELRALGAEPVGFDELIERSDYISLHTPLSSTSRGMIDAAALARMKRGVILVNTSRGPVIDEEALIAALREGRGPAVAALDVFAEEPLAENSPLRAFDNVVLTPHMAGSSEEALAAIRREMADIAIEWFRTSWGPTIVNPEVRDRLRPRLS